MLLNELLRLYNISNVADLTLYLLTISFHSLVFNLINHLSSHNFNILNNHVKVFLVVILHKIIIRKSMKEIFRAAFLLGSRLLFQIGFWVTVKFTSWGLFLNMIENFPWNELLLVPCLFINILLFFI